jgi:hypothetical protein
MHKLSIRGTSKKHRHFELTILPLEPKFYRAQNSNTEHKLDGGSSRPIDSVA